MGWGLMSVISRSIGVAATSMLMAAAVSDRVSAQEATSGAELPTVEITTEQDSNPKPAKRKPKATQSQPAAAKPQAGAAPVPAIDPEFEATDSLPANGSASDQIEAVAQSTSGSVSVMTQQRIKNAGVESVQDVARHTPNAILTNQGSPRFSVNAIRGIGSTVRDDYFNSSLGVFIDGVPATTAEYSRRLGDVESVEVLRGPQGTLFGVNSAAGVINITTRAPTDVPVAEVQGTIGNNGQRGGSALLSGPLLGNVVTGRAFFDYVERDGFTDYADTGKSIDDLSSVTGSGSLQFRPSSQFSATITGSLEHVDQGAYAYQPFDTYKQRFVDITPPNEEVRDSRSLSANMVYDFGAIQLRSISGYRDYDVSAEQDLSYNQLVAMFGGGRTTSDEGGEQFSQELRLTGTFGSAFQWVAGAFFQDTTFSYDYYSNSPVVGTYQFGSDYERKEFAGYGEGTLSVGGGLDLTAGVRVTNERHDMQTVYGFDGQESFTLVTPKFAATYNFDDDRRAYVSATRGARSGGFNRLSNGDEFDPEFLWSYEVGLKSEWFARALTLNVAAFYIDWTDQQIRTQTGPGVVLIDNAGESHSQGVEFEARWRPTQGLELAGFLGFSHGEYDVYVNRFGVDLAGNKLSNMPEMTAGLSAQYRWPIDGTPLFGVVRADYLYTGDQYFDAENRLEQEGYSIVNLRAGIENDKFSLFAFAKNVFDEDYRAYGYRDFETSMLASDIAVAGESRLVGVTATWRY